MQLTVTSVCHGCNWNKQENRSYLKYPIWNQHVVLCPTAIRFQCLSFMTFPTSATKNPHPPVLKKMKENNLFLTMTLHIRSLSMSSMILFVFSTRQNRMLSCWHPWRLKDKNLLSLIVLASHSTEADMKNFSLKRTTWCTALILPSSCINYIFFNTAGTGIFFIADVGRS